MARRLHCLVKIVVLRFDDAGLTGRTVSGGLDPIRSFILNLAPARFAKDCTCQVENNEKAEEQLTLCIINTIRSGRGVFDSTHGLFTSPKNFSISSSVPGS